MKTDNYKDKINELEARVEKIETRNKRVEGDKTWETSITRKIIIAILTYFIIVLFLVVNKNPDPYKNAVIPTIGFILSTLSLSLFRKIWEEYKK